MQNIDILLHTLNHSGVPHASVTLANRLARENMPVRLVIWGMERDVPYPLDNKVTVKFLGVEEPESLAGKAKYYFDVFTAIEKYMSEEKPVNIIASAKESAVILLMLRMVLQSKCSIIGVNAISTSAHVDSQNILARCIYKMLYRFFLPKADHMIAVSQGIADDLVEKYNIDREKVDVVYPALAERFFNGDIKAASAKNREILFVGTLNERKAPEVLLRVFACIVKDIPDVILRYVGDGPMRGELEDTAVQQGIAGKVIFEGSQSDIPPYMQKASVLVMTSHFEGLPQVLVESIACGTPVVSFDFTTGPSEIVIEGVNGHLVYNRDEEELGRKIKLALETRWNQEVMARSIQKFHPEKVMAEYIGVVRKAFY